MDSSKKSSIYSEDVEDDDEFNSSSSYVTSMLNSTITYTSGTTDHEDSISEQSKSHNAEDKWTLWMLEKEKKARKEILEKVQEKKLIKMKADEERKNKEKIKKLAAIKYNEWLKSKNKDSEIRNNNKQKEKQEKLKNEKNVKEEKHLKAEKSYEEWLAKKQVEFNESLEKRKDAALLNKKTKEEKKKLNNESYAKWYKSAQYRPTPAFCSYGYAGSHFISYYDATSPPTPSFINPKPWIYP